MRFTRGAYYKHIYYLDAFIKVKRIDHINNERAKLKVEWYVETPCSYYSTGITENIRITKDQFKNWQLKCMI